MKPYYVIKEVDDKDHQAFNDPPLNEEVFDLNDERYFFGGREYKISDKIYLVVPLKEISRVFKIPLSDFMSDDFMDTMNKLAKKQGHPVIVNIDE